MQNNKNKEKEALLAGGYTALPAENFSGHSFDSKNEVCKFFFFLWTECSIVKKTLTVELINLMHSVMNTLHYDTIHSGKFSHAVIKRFMKSVFSEKLHPMLHHIIVWSTESCETLQYKQIRRSLVFLWICQGLYDTGPPVPLVFFLRVA